MSRQALPGSVTRHHGQMTLRLPPVLTSLDLPLAELCAARLDGELYSVGAAFAPVDEIEQPQHRAAALRTGIHKRLIAEQRTAAWIWGALTAAPMHHQYCATVGARVSRTNVPWLTVREVVIDPREVLIVNGLGVTSPLRTAVDMARFLPNFAQNELDAVTRLMRLGGFGIAECLALMNIRKNLPNKRQAARRLARVDAVDVVNGVNAPDSIEHTIKVGRVSHLKDETTERQSFARRRDGRRENVDVVLAQYARYVG
jgi:hypothetical protein